MDSNDGKPSYPVTVTEQGLPIHEIGGEPYVKDVDLGTWLGMAQPINIRQTIANNINELSEHESIHLVREMIVVGKGAKREVDVNYLTEDQVFQLTLWSRTPKGKEFRRLLIELFKAWRDGKLGAPDAKARKTARSPRIEPNYPVPGRLDFSRSRFAFGRPSAVHSSFVASMAKDKRLVRFPTKLDITVTTKGDDVFIFDTDLGHAIGGDNTHKARPAARRMGEALRTMGPEPYTMVRNLQWNKLHQTDSSVFSLNHEQAKAVAEVLDPEGYTDIQYRLDTLFYLIANARLTSTADSREGYQEAMRLDAVNAAKRKSIAVRYREKTVQPDRAPLPEGKTPDPYHTIALAETIEQRFDDLERRLTDMANHVTEAVVNLRRPGIPGQAGTAAITAKAGSTEPSAKSKVTPPAPVSDDGSFLRRVLAWGRQSRRTKTVP